VSSLYPLTGHVRKAGDVSGFEPPLSGNRWGCRPTECQSGDIVGHSDGKVD